MSHSTPSLFDKSIIAPAIGDSFRKLDPRLMIKNPVMFVTQIGAVLTTVAIFTSHGDRGFVIQLAITLRRIRRSMPLMPMALSSPPMVVGIRQTNNATRTGMVKLMHA